MSVTTDIQAMITDLRDSLETAINEMITWRPTTFTPASPVPFDAAPVTAYDGAELLGRIDTASASLAIPIDADMTGLPVFAGNAPQLGSVLEIPFNSNPLADFDGERFVSPQFQSAILDMLEQELRQDIEEGRLGIPEGVERQIWDREAERDLIAVNRSLKLAGDTFAKQGFSLPPGKLDAKRQEILAQYTATQNTRSREIAEKQADMTSENHKLAVTSLIDTQKMHMDFTLRYGDYLFRIARETVDAMILIYNSRIARFAAENDGYKTEASVFASRVQAYVAQFSAIVEKARAQGVLATSALGAKVQGVLAAVDVERLNKNVELENVRTSAEAYRVFEAALTSRIQILAEQIKAENQVQLSAQKAAADLLSGLAQAVNTSDANITVSRITAGV